MFRKTFLFPSIQSISSLLIIFDVAGIMVLVFTEEYKFMLSFLSGNNFF